MARKAGDIGSPTTGNISLDIKYIFINFLQQFFANHSTFTWNSDLKLTKIVIADKNAVELEIVEKRPAIICARGSMAWTNANPGQVGQESNFMSDLTLAGRVDTADRERNKTYTDLLSATVTLHVLSKSGIQAEQIASDVFQTLTVYKTELRKKGVHKVVGLSYGEEQNLKTSANIEYASVPVAVSFLTQKTLRRGEIANNCTVFITPSGGTAVQQYEGINFIVRNNGTQIVFEYAPAAGSTVTAKYVDANSYSTVEATLLPVGGTVDGVEKVFTIPSNGSILGYYSLLKAIKVADTTAVTETINPSGNLDPAISGTWIYEGTNS